MSKRTRKMVVVVAGLVGVLLFEAATPQPARASDAAEIAAITVGCIALYVAVVSVGAYFTTYRQRGLFPDANPADLRKDARRKDRVRFGPRCHPKDGAPVLFCW